MKQKMKMIAILAIATGVVGSMYFDEAKAATQSITENIAFDTALSLTKNSDIDFGIVEAGVASTYTITTAGVTSATGLGQYLGGTPSAGDITIAGSASQLLNISVGGYTANNGVTPSAATCAYDGGAAGSCAITGAAAPGAGKTLLVGASAIVDGTQSAGSSAAPSFTITAVYQ